MAALACCFNSLIRPAVPGGNALGRSSPPHGKTAYSRNPRYHRVDGWNLVAELDGNNQPVKTYVWGIDLSGSEQGAGGVGGLLSVTDASGGTYYANYDGNGNITSYVNSAGNVSYSCFYTPFGSPVDESGVKPCDFGFSTKYTDQETGLVYYGYRYYQAEVGRWLNRDPWEEEELENAICYVFIKNNGILYYDYLGLKGGRINGDKGKGVLGLSKVLSSLKKLCSNTNCTKCEDKDKCDKEASAIAHALTQLWQNNFGKGDNRSDDNVGGYLCWQWAEAFEGALAKQTISSAKVSLNKIKRKKGDNIQQHFYITLDVGGKGTDECKVKVDDSWADPNQNFVHTGSGWPDATWEPSDYKPDPTQYANPPMVY